jgi:hypothetical protein
MLPGKDKNRVAYTETPAFSDGHDHDSDGWPMPTPGMPPIPVRRRKPMKRFVREYIDQRRIAVRQNRDLLSKDVKNVNRVFYILRDPMQKYGWEPEGWGDRKDGGKDRRKTVIEYIKDVCDELGIIRASIGIVTDNVGYLYYNRTQHTVGIDHLKSLMHKGTDVLIVEKQDVALSLSPLAAPYRIALLSTRGFLTENATDLARLANDDGANIAILTDYDISGAVIAAKVPQVHRIGIDEQTLEDLGIFREITKLEEEYTPNPSHLQHVKDNPWDFEDLDLDYLESKRIEIDIVMEHVGNERFWQWVLDKLEKQFPNRDYDRVTDLPKSYQFKPDELDNVDRRVRDYISHIMEPVIEQKIQELKNYAGFIEDVDEYERETYDEIKDYLDENLNLELLQQDLQKILDRWDSGYYFNNNIGSNQ